MPIASLHLNLTEENFVPDAVAADDPPADLCTFSLSGKVEQPALQRRVRLAEDLQEKTTVVLFWKIETLQPNLK